MSNVLQRELSKWTQTVQISSANFLAYKGDVLLQVIGPAVVFFLIKYQLWSSIYDFADAEVIKGYTIQSMIEYQAWVMLVGFISQSYNSRHLAEDIRLGRISSYLLYPFEFWHFHTARFIAFQLIQLSIVAVSVVALYISGFLPSLTLSHFVIGALYTSLIGLLWFSIHFALGILAFWLDETWMLRVTFIIIANFFSGAVLPLELFPDALRSLLYLLPFPYMTYVPVKIFMGVYEGSVLYAISVVLLWITILSVLSRLIWARGIRLYTAAGM